VVVAAAILRERKARDEARLHRAEAERQQLEKNVLEARLQLMQAQVEPHFLFNTLANVQHLVETDPPQASEMLESLIQYLRAALPQMRESATNLGREVDMARAFLEIHRIRMGSRLEWTVDVPAHLRSAPFPPMMLISLVENALKHGVDPRCECSSVAVRAGERDGKLFVAVADTGAGIVPKQGGGIGLANIRERLKALHGTAARLDARGKHAERRGRFDRGAAPRGIRRPIQPAAREGGMKAVEGARVAAVIADDEPLLRAQLRSRLERLWPELAIVHEMPDGRGVDEVIDEHAPALFFLDIHMPGVNGLEAARQIGSRAHVVFVTAYDQHAVEAFERGAIDYVLKPFNEERLAITVDRLKARLAGPPSTIDALVEHLAERLGGGRTAEHLKWIRASVGPQVRLIPVEEVLFFQSDESTRGSSPARARRSSASRSASSSRSWTRSASGRSIAPRS
jgi:DNA-binding LytR/AlgR family response regulator